MDVGSANCRPLEGELVVSRPPGRLVVALLTDGFPEGWLVGRGVFRLWP